MVYFRNTKRSYYTSGNEFSNAFNPRDLLNLKLWLDGNQGITTVSGNVSNWADMSGGGNDVAQSTAGNRPVYNTNPKNSLPTLAFSNTNATYLSSSSANLAPTNISLFCLCRFTANATVQFVVSRGDTGFAGYFFAYQSQVIGGHLGVGSPTAVNPAGNTRNSGTWDMFSITYNGTTSKFYQNGTLATQLSLSGSLDYTNTPTFYVGQSTGLTANRYLTGDVGEIIEYSVGLSDINRRRVTKYLGRKWALTVAT